jgi:hypothetical protein
MVFNDDEPIGDSGSLTQPNFADDSSFKFFCR